MLKILSKRERVILFATIGVIVFAIILNFLILPLLARNDNLNKRIELTRKKLTKFMWLLSQRENIKGKYGNFSSTFSPSNQQEDVLVRVLSELENLAKAADVKIIDIRPQVTSSSSGTYKEILIDLRTEGIIDGYLKFIYELEKSLLLLKVNKLQLATKPNTSILEGSFSISQLSGAE